MTKLIINQKISFIQNSLKTLADILKKREESIMEDYLLLAMEREAEKLIESAISINQEILKSHFEHLSESYYDSFMNLSKLNVFSEKELRTLASTASFRNRLARDYLILDDELTVRSIRKILAIYPSYLQKIKQFLDRD